MDSRHPGPPGPHDAVRMLITRPPVEVVLQEPLRKAAQTLAREVIGVGLVRQTWPPAVVSERDIVAAIAEGADPDQERVEDVMTDDVVSVRPRDPVLEAGRRMLENEVRHLPVIDDGVVVGVVSERDVLRALVAYLAAG
jgi:signal-transduction protein with cAMP-binding, CBS, and nucleotidyltransferase domain